METEQSWDYSFQVLAIAKEKGITLSSGLL